MGVIIEQQQRAAVAGIDDFGAGGDKDKKKRRPRRKQNSPPAGPSFNSGQQGEATKCSQSSSFVSTSSSSVGQHVPNESDVAYVSMPTFHLGEQGMKHNLDAKANFRSCPTRVPFNESIRSSLDVSFVPPFTEGCSQQSCFEPHWSLEDVNEALSKGEVFEATFRVNAHNRLEAYCIIDGVPTDVLISGIPMQNRAIDGDIVALIVDPPMFWTRMKGSFGYANNPGTSGDHLLPEVAAVDDRLKAKCKLDDCEEELDNVKGCFGDINSCIVASGVGDEGSSSDQNDEATYAVEKLCEAISAFPSKRPTGRVVAITEPSPRRNTIVGFLNIKQWLSSRESCGKSNRKKKNLVANVNTEYIQFSPTNPKFPKMVVPVRGLPDSVKKRLNDGDMSIEMELVAAMISEWGEKYPLPQARVLDTLGRAGEIQPHIAAILFENDICCLEFSSESLACLPHDSDSWEVPEAELRNRRDIRNLCLFTIDPPTATDLDDALSIERLSSGVYRVGVHIADVSYFVQPDTALDVEAQVRSTSVYMIQRKLPMLPPKLSENLGSLIPGVDRLAFSIFWDFDTSGNIIDRWTGRTVIHSCCKLSYDHAEDILEGRRIGGNNFNPEQDGLPQLHGNFEWKDVISSVRSLHEISKILKEKRFIDGALVLENSKLSFVLDEFGVPYDSKLYDRKDSNFLVEELMLLANRTAAEIISLAYPESALLRRHPEPNMRKLRELESFCIKHGLELDASSSRSFRCSLEKIRDKLKDDSVLYDILISNATKPMQLAKYFCTGDVKVSQNEWGHYALAVPFYTHFTSPLRRYPDIVVHRTLSAAIEAEHVYMKQQKLLGKANQVEEDRCFTGINFNKLAAESDEGKKSLSAAALRNRIPRTEILLDVADHCNKRKSACKNVKDAIDRLYMWVLIKNKQVLLSEARVLALGPKFMSIYIPALTTERRIYYDEVEGLASEWFEATSTLVLSLWIGGKRFHRRGSPGKCKVLEDVALIVNPLQLNSGTDLCAISQSEDSISKSGSLDAEVNPTVFPLTVGLLSTIPVALHALGGADGPLDIAARLYVSSYFA